MRLRDLEATFVGGYHVDAGGHECHTRMGDTIVHGVQGIDFQCPLCAQGKPVEEEDGVRFVRGVHHVLCWFTNPVGVEPVPADAFPRPGRWTFAGTSIDDVTFTGPAAASVALTGPGCGWHGFVVGGGASLR